MGNFISCCKLNDIDKINTDDNKIFIINKKVLNQKKKKFKTSPGPPVIVERTVVDSHYLHRNLDLVPYLN